MFQHKARKETIMLKNYFYTILLSLWSIVILIHFFLQQSNIVVLKGTQPQREYISKNARLR